jgi:hypothetical protein
MKSMVLSSTTANNALQTVEIQQKAQHFAV